MAADNETVFIKNMQKVNIINGSLFITISLLFTICISSNIAYLSHIIHIETI